MIFASGLFLTPREGVGGSKSVGLDAPRKACAKHHLGGSRSGPRPLEETGPDESNTREPETTDDKVRKSRWESLEF